MPKFNEPDKYFNEKIKEPIEKELTRKLDAEFGKILDDATSKSVRSSELGGLPNDPFCELLEKEAEKFVKDCLNEPNSDYKIKLRTHLESLKKEYDEQSSKIFG
ncbi:hypothetical protein [Piscirickettsia litoralis]|uniref:Uncharacterized protein n=1 Tax=Piscirickettsia litoralis TaxID=1891921 RepID=A0ABX3A5T1_9GAMM|nr:hypothetical protein [Piscirickettsia litoralis]ODN41474.1 hypothetical protein BGC07_15275 [Piscirickettsia litoralis]